MLRRYLRVVLALILIIVGPAGAANAAPNEPSGKTKDAVSVPMTVKSFDRSVAEAHGFRIDVDKNGVESSIPVTAEAKALQAQADLAAARAASTKSKGNVATPYGSVSGDCGSSFVYAKKYSGDWLGVTTGYSVYLNVVDRSWFVNGIGTLRSTTIHFLGGSTPATWSGTGGGTVVGPGYAVVPFTAHVILTNGAVCYSGAPADFFG